MLQFELFFFQVQKSLSKLFSFRYRSLFQQCFLLGTEVFFKSILLHFDSKAVIFQYLFLLGTEVFSTVFSFRYRSLFQTCFLLGTEVFFNIFLSFRYRSIFQKLCFLHFDFSFLFGTEVVFGSFFFQLQKYFSKVVFS